MCVCVCVCVCVCSKHLEMESCPVARYLTSGLRYRECVNLNCEERLCQLWVWSAARLGLQVVQLHGMHLTKLQSRPSSLVPRYAWVCSKCGHEVVLMYWVFTSPYNHGGCGPCTTRDLGVQIPKKLGSPFHCYTSTVATAHGTHSPCPAGDHHQLATII